MADGSPGGGPTVVQILCKSLGDLGIDAAVATQTNSHLSREARLAGIRTFEADFSHRMKAWQAGRRMHEILEEARPDVLLAHGARSTLPAALLRRNRRPPLVHVVHGLHYTRKPFLTRVLGRATERFCVSRADRTVFVANADEAMARRHHILGRAGHDVIHNGVAVPPGLVRSLADRRFDIAFIGRLHVQKDPLILPEILLAMRPRRPSMLIVAGGDLEQALRAKIEVTGVGEQIVFAGPQRRHEALRLLSQARVCVLPSLWEGLPVSLAEAMLLQVAVVASDIPGNSEIVRAGMTGLLAPVGDARGFASAITRLLTSDSLWQTLTTAAIDHARVNFSALGQAKAYRGLFASVMSEHPSVRSGALEAL
ncbi:glycosyltransferase family 4 protein [Lichenicoccus sp.]|uniref:glycosyltransferase family 4 protein n=1 Tax=Lichenicoccus sp. TaxID=2781899 RepID=UPI003D0A9A70